MMSRDDVSIRQHRSRLLQLAESTSSSKSSGKRRGYSNAQLLRSNGGSSGSASKLLQELVRNDPSYTPNIEHLVFPDRRNSNAGTKSPVISPITAIAPSKSSSNSKNTSNTKPTRSRLAEVFALSRYSHHSHQGGSVDSKMSKSSSSKTSKFGSRKSLGSILMSSSKDGGGGGVGGGRGVGGGHQPTGGGTGRGEGPPRRWASEEPVLQQPQSETGHQQQTRTSPSPDSGKVWRSADQPSKQQAHLSPAQSQQDTADMATTRGPNVSILHLRSTSEPWETVSTTSTYNVGSRPSSRSSVLSHMSSIPTLQVKHSGNTTPQTRNTNYASLPSARRRDAGPAALFIAGSVVSSSVDRGTNNGTCSRELSPVRWCDREVDGVYLGRSGWVQVQQRSLDENRRANYGILPLPPSTTSSTTVSSAPVGGTLPSRRPGIKLADYHCSNSEPGKFPVSRQEEQQRPAFLPLPIGITKGRDFEHRISSRSASPSPQDPGLSGDPMSPPSVTPIISPPPAFQDSNRRYQTAPRLRTNTGKAPFLPRSNAIVDSDIVSPPPSPPPPINWSTLPSPRTTTATTSLRVRRLTPSPVGTPLQPPLRIPQTKSLEDTTGSGTTRRTQFQKYDSSSSSSSSFGFRSLDSTINPRAAMPRLSETDSSIGGYEDGDEDENRESSLNLSSGFSTITVINSSPDTPAAVSGLQPKERVLVNGEKISPSSLRHRDSNRLHHQNQTRSEHRSHPLRRSPGSEGNNKKLVSNNSSSSSSSSSSSCTGRTGSSQAFRRSVSHSIAKQQQQQQQQQPVQVPVQQVQPTLVRMPEPAPHGYHTWDGRNRVRRSRSLQLPETKSPGALSPSSHSHPECQYMLVKQHPQHYYLQQQQQQPPQPQLPQQQTEPHRVVVKIGGEPAERPRRPFIQHRKAQSEESRYEDGLRWEEEARAVTDYLHGTRSRAAARALLQARYHADHEMERRTSKETEPGFNIFFVTRNKSSKQPQQQPQQQQQQQQQRQRVLQRGVTTPTTAASHVFCPDINPCNPDTCDFWPHCAHRDSLYPPSSHSKSSTPSPSSGPKLPASVSSAPITMRLSQSYPTTAVTQNHRGRNESRRTYDNDEKGKRGDSSRGGGQSTRSSPASLERVDEYDHTLPRKNQSGLNGIGSVSERKPVTLEAEEKKSKWRNSAQQCQHSQIPRRPATFGVNSERLKGSLDTAVSSLDREADQYRRDTGFNIGMGLIHRQQSASAAIVSPMMDLVENDFERPVSVLKERKVSPVMASVVNSRSPSAVGGSSSSSSSSDVWVTTSDRTVTKSPKTQKSSGTSTPLEDASSTVMLMSKSPIRDRDKSVLEPRPGSAPAEVEENRNKMMLESQQRSLSLPKSFLSERVGIKTPKQSGLFPWKRQGTVGSPCSTPSPGLRPPTPETSRTAPATPVRDPSSGGQDTTQYRRSPGLSKSVRHTKVSSTPHDDPVTSRSDWDIRRPWPHANADKETIVSSSYLSSQATLPLLSHPRLSDNKDFSQSQRNISGNASESVLQKFRKSFAFKFHKKGGSKEGSEGGEDVMDEQPLGEEETAQLQSTESPPPPPPPPPSSKDDASSDSKFKFGPLVWRSSKERKKGKKAARNAKCNSGDSGIQLEMASGSTNVAGGDSSESHDTDHQVDDEPLDEMDSPPAVRRRVTTEKTSRPQSEVINQLLIEKFKADLQTRVQNRHQHVRRTHSDLGGQRLFNWDVRNSYRRMFSTPSPIKMRPPRTSPPRPSNTDAVTLRSSKRRSRRPQLRRSISQPLGLNELSPLMRRKPGGMPVVQRTSNTVLSEDEHDGRGGTGTSDDDMMSDSESSIASLTDRKKSFEQAMDEDVAVLAEAVWDHVAMETEELAFRAGDVIEVVDTVDRDWWWGSRGEDSGWFPAAFVRLRVSQEDTVEDCLAAMASGSTPNAQLRRRTSVSLLSNDQVRSSVVRELVNTERDFVKILRDVAEGYLAECRRRTDMFSPQQIDTIFGNLEELLEFQSTFLQNLESHVEWDAPHRSCIGECFLAHRAGFRIYSEYCNSHPMATATLQELYQHNSYSKFFEACRLMRGLIEIPLDGYLLTPVQRICKYPLQLAELLKYTKADHADYDKIREALDAMRNVAVLINERKRRMESLEKLAAWQQRVEGWEGEDLIEHSSQLIHQGEVVRVTTGMWTNNITLFLFDHQLVYCKKDILKRNTYVYKGRIHLDTSEVVDVPDGKDPQLGVMVRHGLKVYSCIRDKWLLFCCRSAEEKQRWLDAMAEERRLVDKDRQDGLEFPPTARQLARMAARCQRRPPSKPRNKNYKRNSGYSTNPSEASSSHRNLSGSQSAQGSTHSLGRKVGTWFTFGSSKKGRTLMRTPPHHQHT